jgi:hypothetical protein
MLNLLRRAYGKHEVCQPKRYPSAEHRGRARDELAGRAACVAGFQFRGSKSARRDAGWSAMRGSTSASQTRGSISFTFADWISVAAMDQ